MAATTPEGGDDGPDLPDDGADPAGDVADLRPPDLKSARFGSIGKFLRYRRYRKKLRKKAQQGYVQWILLDGSHPKPKFVKPEHEGAGIPELEHDGGRFLFPREAMVPDARTGMWTIYHHADDSTPINARDPSQFAIDPGRLQEYAEMKYETTPPGFLEGLSLPFDDPQTAFAYLVMAIIAFSLIWSVLGGAL